MGAPAIVIASTHHTTELGEAFARYEREYDVRMASDEATAKSTAKHLLTTGHQVALFVVDTDQEQDTLYKLIGGTRQAVPTARRLIVTHVSRFRDDNQTFRHAVAAGKVDALLLMPQGPRDEEFHLAVGELLNEWNATVATPVVENVRIIAPEKDALTRDLLDYLARVGMPAGVHHPDSEVGREVMASCPEDEGRWPVVSSMSGWCGHCPDVRSLANQLYGRPDDIDVDEVVDLVVVGAGPAGLAASVYASSEGSATRMPAWCSTTTGAGSRPMASARCTITCGLVTICTCQPRSATLPAKLSSAARAAAGSLAPLVSRLIRTPRAPCACMARSACGVTCSSTTTTARARSAPSAFSAVTASSVQRLSVP